MFRAVFWVVLPCKMIVDRRFRGACCLHHQGWDAVRTWNLTPSDYALPLMWETKFNTNNKLGIFLFLWYGTLKLHDVLFTSKNILYPVSV
jgi:hypothetical protein